MRVAFVLPFFSDVPIGGYAIVYEYANGLQSRGHRVTVVHPRPGRSRPGPRGLASTTRWRLVHRRLGHRAVDWFAVDPAVRLAFVPEVHQRFVPPGDAVVATAWRTAPTVSRCGPQQGAKLYLLQHYETWDGPQEEVDATWRLPLHKIAIARWLAELAKQFGEADNTTYIPNGIDVTRFRVEIPIEERSPHRVAMLFHPASWKGVADGLEALSAVRREFPRIEAVLFGTFPRPEGLPSWVTYVENPHGEQLVRLYNGCSVFLHPSWAEGSPLPPAEAMACGCALVAAANPGVCDYARDGHNAVLAPVKAPGLLADALSKVLGDEALRRSIAFRGHADMQARGWSSCIDRFEALIGALQPVAAHRHMREH